MACESPIVIAFTTRHCPHTKITCRFRWAELQLKSIRDLKILRPSYISAALHEMPRTLDQTYERILAAIDDLYFDEVRTALEWLAFSMTPLSVAELAEACSIRLDDDGVPFLDEGGHDALVGLFGVISSLILVGDSPSKGWRDDHYYAGEPYPEKYATSCYTERVRLAHFSVKEYLVSSRLQQSDRRLSRYALKETEVHRSLGQSCCAYFLCFTKMPQIENWIEEEKEPAPGNSLDASYVDRQDYLNDFTPAYPLLPYVCKQWVQHQALTESGMEPPPLDARLHLEILGDERVRISWLRLVGHVCEVSPDYGDYLSPLFASGKWHDGTKALYWASALGLRQTVALLCGSASRQDVCNVAGFYNTALQAAAYCGDEIIAEILLISGAEIGCEGGYFGTALQAAAYNGNETIVDMLLSNGADAACECGHFTTALLAAAHRGHSSVVSRLLQENLSTLTLNTKAENYGSALETAANQGYTQVVDELLQAGADHGEAMLRATKGGHEEVMRIFIDRGTDLNIRYPGGRWYDISHEHTVLGVAVERCSDDMVKLLIQTGADAELASREGLLAAAKNGHVKKFEMLVQAGAKVDPSSSELLLDAVKGGSVGIVEMLVQAGVELTQDLFEVATDYIPSSAGYARQHSNGEAIAELLIRSGLQVAGEHGSLRTAASKGSEKLVALLLQAGATDGCSEYASALITAATWGHEAVVSLLLDAGVYPHDTIDGLEACSCRHEALMEAINFGLYLNPRDDVDDDDISQVAVTIIQKLIDAGAHVHEGNDVALHMILNTPPSSADLGWSRHIPLVKLLLANGADVRAQPDDVYPLIRLSDSSKTYAQSRPSMLYAAARNGSTELVRILLDHGADINGYGWTRYSPEHLQFYLDLNNDAESHARCCLDRYDSILLGGIRNGRVDVVKLLLDSGADIKTVDATEACTLIAAAALTSFHRLEPNNDWILLATAIVDKMLEVRGADDAVFDETISNGALKVSLKRFALREEDLLLPIKNLIQERRAVFISQHSD